jgi:hypothetical protein
MMDTSLIRENLAVNARNPGIAHGPCMVNIGTVERVETSGYIKLKRTDDLDGRDHWFPLEWVESVDERTVCLNQSAEKVMAGLVNQLPISY